MFPRRKLLWSAIKTPMHDKANHAALAKFHPLARMGEISDIVDAVLYLQKATFVTGENIRASPGPLFRFSILGSSYPQFPVCSSGGNSNRRSSCWPLAGICASRFR